MTKIIIAAAFSSFFLNLFGVSWEQVDEKIATEYPSVAFISVLQLQDAMQGATNSAVLFDVREPEEFAVSHIARSINLATAAEIASVIHDKDAPIIVYCSVGYRSAGVAEQLQQLGFTNVRNLQHSLFAWANSGYPMVNAEGSTPLVHPYNRSWGALVEKSLRSYVP